MKPSYICTGQPTSVDSNLLNGQMYFVLNRLNLVKGFWVKPELRAVEWSFGLRVESGGVECSQDFTVDVRFSSPSLPPDILRC